MEKEEEKTDIPKTNFIIMVGIVGSGKSYKAEEIKKDLEATNSLNGLKREVVILSSDAIREEITGDVNCQTRNDEVFSLLHKRIKENIKTNDVIVDATNVSQKSRQALLNCVKKVDCYKICYVMTTPLDVCKKQNANRDRVVPVEVIEKQVRNFQIPFYEEGLDEIILDGWSEEMFKSFKTGWNIQTDPIFETMKGFDQRNSHHIYTLEDHCWRTTIHVAQRYWNNKPMCRAATIHDIGKLYTGEPKDDGSGNWGYKGHMNYGTYVLLQNLDLLGFNNLKDILDCLFYVNYHMEPFFWQSEGKDGTKYIKDSTVEKMKKKYGEYKYHALLWFNYCDKLASGTDRENMNPPRDPSKPEPMRRVHEAQDKVQRKKKDYGPVVSVRNKYGVVITKPFKLLSKKQKKKVKKEARLKRKAERRALKAQQEAENRE